MEQVIFLTKLETRNQKLERATTPLNLLSFEALIKGPFSISTMLREPKLIMHVCWHLMYVLSSMKKTPFCVFHLVTSPYLLINLTPSDLIWVGRYIYPNNRVPFF